MAILRPASALLKMWNELASRVAPFNDFSGFIAGDDVYNTSKDNIARSRYNDNEISNNGSRV